MPIQDSNSSDQFDNTIIVVEDGQDGNGKRASVETKSTGKNAIHVIAEISSVIGGVIPSLNKKLRYDDMNSTTGGVARGTLITNATFVNVYSYTGSGLVIGFNLNLENKDKWQIRFTVDSEQIFGTNGIFTADMVDDAVYDLDDAGSPLSTNEGRLGVSMEEHDRFIWTAPSNFPVKFNSSFSISAKRIAGEASKKFNAGLVVLTKET